MTNKISINDFGIDKNKIPNDIEVIYESLSKKRKTKLEKTYISTYHFLAILYYFYFVDKLEINAIAEKLHLKVVDVHLHLYNLGWWISNDYESNKVKIEEEVAKAMDAVKEANEKSWGLDLNEHYKLKDALNKAKEIKPKIFLDLGFKTSEEFARVFYYLISIKKISPIVLMRLFNLTYYTIHSRLTSLGINLSHEEGIQEKKIRKSQNYSKTILAGKKTRIKALYKNYSTGSRNQEYVRAQISNTIINFLDNSKYEVIVGVSNTGILGALEIDIPIVIYNPKENRIFRFAIEYNSVYYHTDERDNNKKELATDKGWFYKPIIEISDGQFSNDNNLLNREVNQICEYIKNIVESNDKKTGNIKL